MDDRHGARSTSRRQNPAYDRPVRLIPQKPDHVGSMTGMQADDSARPGADAEAADPETAPYGQIQYCFMEYGIRIE